MAISHHISMIVTTGIILILATLTTAIKVDWNTNTGPIVPPTSTQPPVPKPPFREPAQVWEDQTNDIENPDPFIYVLPPPSRPRYNPDDNNLEEQNPPKYGVIVSHPNQLPNHDKKVPQLSVQYIPNVGLKYYAIVPSYNQKFYYLKQNNVYDKPNGKYNAKLKKYKAYEKTKPIPYYVNNQGPPAQMNYNYNASKDVVNKS